MAAHTTWRSLLGGGHAEKMLGEGNVERLTEAALAAESKVYNLLYKLERSALRKALEDREAAARFFRALLAFIPAEGDTAAPAFHALVDATAKLPETGGKVLTWPVVTLFPFIADPKRHLFVKPSITQEAAKWVAFELNYQALPNWTTYKNALELARRVKQDLHANRELDLIDVQSFMWVVAKYPNRPVTDV